MGNKSTATQRNPQPGDLIEIDHGPYNHWAVFIGDGYVVHLRVPKRKDKEIPQIKHYKKSIVVKEKLRDVVQGKDWKINNLLDKKYEAQDDWVIVKDALRLVGTELDYNLVTCNCEHWATDLRYGKAESRQVVLGAFFLTGTLAAVIVIAVAIVRVVKVIKR